jgi:hypothetical protein
VIVHLVATGPDWGTVPDWLAAVGILAAFAVALRLLGKELAARREAEEDRRREQARQVSVWATEIEQVPPALGSLVFFVVRANRSDEPVYDVLIEMASNDPGGPGRHGASTSPSCLLARSRRGSRSCPTGQGRSR